MFARAFARTLRTVRSPHFLGLLFKTALLTLLVFILFIIAVGAGLRSFDLTEQGGMVEFLLDAMLTLGASVAGWLLLPVLLPAIAAFFQESIADSIERKDYPVMPPAVQRPLMQELWEDCKFVALIVAVNLLFFITYFIPVVGLFTYYGVNGYLIGREFFETAAARHMGKKNAKALRKENPVPSFLCGALIVFCTNIPVLNLVAPFIGVAIMVHLYHLLPKSELLLPPLKPAGESA